MEENCRLNNRSRMRRESHVRICEGLQGQFPRPTRLLIGVIGSKGECEKIKADITTFMSEKLKLEMSEEKTLITSAQEPAKFLGYEINARRSLDHTRTRSGLQRRSWTGAIVLNLSYETVLKRL